MENLLYILNQSYQLVDRGWRECCRSKKPFAHQDRTLDGIKGKFASLHSKQIPNGYPKMQQEVRRTEQIRLKITDQAGLGDAIDANADDFFDYDYVSDLNRQVDVGEPIQIEVITPVQIEPSLSHQRTAGGFSPRQTPCDRYVL